MRKFLILAASVGLYTIGSASASAACQSESHDANNNKVEIVDLSCQGVMTPGTPSAQMQGSFHQKSNKRLAAEARVQTELTQMVQANPPTGVSRSFLSWLIAAMFGNYDVTAHPAPDHAPVKEDPDKKETDKAKPDATTPETDKKRITPAIKTEDLLCLIEVNGQGATKQVGIVVTSHYKLKVKGLATLTIKGANDVSVESDVMLNLKAGRSKSYPIMTTGVLKGDILSASLDIANRRVICT